MSVIYAKFNPSSIRKKLLSAGGIKIALLLRKPMITLKEQLDGRQKEYSGCLTWEISHSSVRQNGPGLMRLPLKKVSRVKNKRNLCYSLMLKQKQRLSNPGSRLRFNKIRLEER